MESTLTPQARQALAHRAANRLNRSLHRVDTESKTRDDYTQDLLLHAWARFQNDPVPAPLLATTIWNRMKSAARDRSVHTRLKQRYFPSLLPSQSPDDRAAAAESVLEDRSCAVFLERRLSHHETKVLLAIADSPTLQDAATTLGYSRATVARWAKGARERARQILEEQT
jgi:DNA-directed RNA polymerase specialized sigma24 family protein